MSGYFEALLDGLPPAFLTWLTGSWVIRNAKCDPEAMVADMAVMGQLSMIGYFAAGAFLAGFLRLMIIILRKVIMLKQGKIGGRGRMDAAHRAKIGSHLQRFRRRAE